MYRYPLKRPKEVLREREKGDEKEKKNVAITTTAVPLEDWLGEGRLQRLKGVRAAGAMMLC